MSKRNKEEANTPTDPQENARQRRLREKYAIKRNQTVFFEVDPGKLPEGFVFEGPQHPGLQVGNYSFGALSKVRMLGAEVAKQLGNENLGGPMIVVKSLVGDWTLLEDDADGMPMFTETPIWPARTREGMAGRFEILSSLPTTEITHLISRIINGLYLTEEEGIGHRKTGSASMTLWTATSTHHGSGGL